MAHCVLSFVLSEAKGENGSCGGGELYCPNNRLLLRMTAESDFVTLKPIPIYLQSSTY